MLKRDITSDAYTKDDEATIKMLTDYVNKGYLTKEQGDDLAQEYVNGKNR